MSVVSPARRVVFRVDAFERIATQLGLADDTARAHFLGVSQSHYSRVTRGLTNVGESFIAAVLTAVPDMPFEWLFSVEVDQ